MSKQGVVRNGNGALEQSWWLVRDGIEVVGPESDSRKVTPSSGCVAVSPSTKVNIESKHVEMQKMTFLFNKIRIDK